MSKVVRSLSESEVQLWGTEDGDMTEGDLGYGLGRRPGGIYEVEVSHLFTSRKRSDGKNFSPPPFSRQGEESSGGVFQYSKHKSLQDFYSQGSRVSSYQRQSSTDSDSGLSTIELRQRLHETLEEVEFLKTELEASQRQLEGKEEALKILQSMAIFGKATSHTQAVFKKTVEQKRSLEKEINALQWEIEFDQNRFKNIEESWTQKYDRLNCENAVLKETLKLKTEEIKMLKSENAILNQQYLEALAMLDIKQQKMAQENMCHSKSSCFTEISGLELELLQKSKEEAYIMADAFRIAFEQQLMRKNDQALRLTQMDKMCKKATKWINWKHLKEDGTPSHGNKKSLGQKLLDMLPSENSSKKTEDQDNPQEVFKMLIDLLNDKEAALAHQRKVSYMLARALEDKDTASKQNKEKIPMGENFPLKNPCHKTSEFPVLRDPLYSNVQIFNSVGCFCSIHCPATDQNYIRTLKKSCSLPSGIMF
ncbi:coiled-coil domain-containing protein 125 isoform X2 [Dasypus novemcinctus]|uniref:coiled-coil domain-containing protein 125 isoform X2 n=1 Tax=Dasypus novemcinctus TaxID=9361 RepID=UPI00265E35B1|nr:coiled-coil domain-containing protein 125 isoform X2 [Dasypus novemcinctus]XP_058165690.1 coiled-coil domain-containing protein 125 isoform X2 [Dasypus novemcinctus]XP_058165701.1 coiled-coil domain-containing protein 125 isoform X2 [Dasypus novemcinctus]XP_058165712.1 coiled-coil domain-containing protein 125 isoform X2 [Dasypus novemcinctus]